MADFYASSPPDAAGGSGSGTVTSVGLSLPSIFSVSGSPVTTSGTLAGTFTTQLANLVFAGPSSGAAATPTFRALVGADFTGAFTAGSVIFAGSSGELSQNNSRFFWDNSSNQLLTGLGSASFPSRSFTGDANTGMYSAGADTINFATGGVLAVTIDNAGRVGINKTPAFQLDVLGASTSGVSTPVRIVGGTGTSGGGLLLGAFDSTQGGFYSSSVVPGNNNYALLAGATTTDVNATATLYFDVNGNIKQTTTLTNTLFNQANLTGSSATNAFRFAQTLNTSGAPSVFQIAMTDTASNSATKFFEILGGTSAATTLVSVKRDGTLTALSGNIASIVIDGNIYPGNANTSISVYNDGSAAAGFTTYGSTNATATLKNTNAYISGTNIAASGTVNSHGFTSNFSPTSGTAVHNGLSLTETVNQTGGASGITRGIYINPTLTAAVDYRAFEAVSGKVALPVTVSSAGTLTLSNSTHYIFSGATTTWTLPALSGNTGVTYFIKNRGSGSITINSNAGGADIYDTSAVPSITVAAGSAIMLVNDATFWNKE